MRKHLLLILVLLMICAALSATEEDDKIIAGSPENPQTMPASPTFQIRAYRMEASPQLNVVITSAIPSHLDRVEDGQILSIDENYIDRFMGNVGGQDTAMTSFSEHIVFSYRVEGNQTGSFSLELQFEPFYLYVNDAKNENYVIDCAYEIGHETYVFNNPDSKSGFAISRDETNTDQNELTRLVFYEGTQPEGNSFRRTWKVTGNGSADPSWSARGAIALDIGPTSYNSNDTPYGTYRSQVTVILTTN